MLFGQQAKEQMEAAVRDLAMLTWNYFNQLRDQGFDLDEAIKITIAFQDSFIRGGLQNNDRK